MKSKLLKLLIILLSFIIVLNIIDNHSMKNRIRNANMNMFEKILFIPAINLIDKLTDDMNKLDYNLVYYGEFNIDNKIIIFGHSNMGYGNYFNRLDELKIGDISYFYYKNIEYKYEIINIYHVKKEDIFILENEPGSNKVLLVTCDKKSKNKRLVVELGLKSIKNLKK